MQEAQLVIEQLVADEPLRKHCKNIKILLKLHKKSAENRYIYYSAPVN
jgi:hypothetical protein